MRIVQDKWSSTSSSQDLLLIYFSIFLFLISSLGFISSFVTIVNNQNRRFQPFTYLFQSKGWKFKSSIAILISLLIHSILQNQCESSQIDSNSYLCRTHPLSSLLTLFLASLSLLSSWKLGTNVVLLLEKQPRWFRLNSVVLFTCLLLYVAGLMGSSTIEEEHQTFYFIVSTLFFFQFVSRFRKSGNRMVLCCGITLLSMTRLLRSWNQTGNKWLGGDDVHKWLLLEGNHHVSIILLMTSILWVLFYSYCRSSSISTDWIKKTFRICSLISSILLFVYKSSISRLPLDQVTTARLLFFLIFIMFIISFFSNLKEEKMNRIHQKTKKRIDLILISFSNLFLLLHKPQNSFLIVGFWIQLLVFRFLSEDDQTFNNYFTLKWMGYSSFFVLGNSNGISTIDISGAYTGLTDYNQFIVGSLVGIIILSGPIFFFLGSIPFLVPLVKTKSGLTSNLEWKEEMMEKEEERQRVEMNWRILLSCLSTLSIRSVVLLLFSTFIVLHRNHLFIWSVFSPKYIYEILFFLFDLLQCLSLFSISMIKY